MKKLFILVALAATLAPATFVIYKAGGWENWQGVLPKGTTDSRYYYARIHEVVDGHPLNGNPYVYEHRGDYSPAFFIPDIISAMPMLIGLPFNLGVVLNVFIWSFVFLAFACTLFRLLHMPKWWAFLWTVLLYMSAYSFMLRPTVMQIVYPVFIAFLIALIRFLHEPLSRRRAIWLSVIAASTFYIYTYLSYIVLITLTVIFLRFVIKKRFQEVKSLAFVALLSGLMLIPFGIYTWMQMAGPHYFEILTRIGLLYTHTPSIEAFFYGRWVVIGLIAAAFLSRQKTFWFSTGIAILVSLFLNVVTGVELMLGIHVGRFVVLWVVMIFGSLIYEWHSKRLLLPAILLLILFLGVARNISRGLDFFKFDNRGIKVADVQPIAGPLNWLDKNVQEESVIWSNETIGEYIPIMTRHYPMYFHGATLHNISNEELEDRHKLWENRDFSKFNVKYLIFDRLTDNLSSSLQGALYDDGRFVIVLLPLND